jgi:DNA-binding CsgD family transcriptional regulator
VLLGRSRESRELDRALALAAAGTSAIRVLLGPPGIGKTTLLSSLVERALAAPERWQVLSARGHQEEGVVPYAALTSVLGRHLDDLAGLPERLGTVLRRALGRDRGPAPEPFLVASATLQALAQLASHGPTLLVLDDVHWLDRQSSLALLFAVRRLRHEPLASFLTVRAGTPAATRLVDFPLVRVGGLAPPDAAELLRRSYPDLAPLVAAELVLRCDGNPLALLETGRALSADQRAGLAALDGAGSVEARTPVARQVLAAGTTARLAALVVALEPALTRATALRALASLGLASSALAEAEDAGLVRANGDGLAPGHPLVAAAVVETADPVERHQVHLALAGAIRAEGGTETWRPAWHEGRAVDRPSEPHARELDGLAGIARAQGDVSTAARVLEQAAAVTPDPEARAARLVAAGECAILAGLPHAVELLTRGREAGTDPTVRARADRLVALHAAPRGDVQTVARIAARYDAGHDRAGAAVLHALAGEAAYVRGLAPDLERHVRAALPLAEGLPDTERLLVDVCHLHDLARRGSYDHALAHRVAATFLAHVEPDLAAPVAQGLLHSDEWELARRVVDAVLPLARQRSQVPALTWLETVAAELALHDGDLDRATACAVEALTMAHTIGHETAAMHAEAVLALVDSVAGRAVDCESRARRVTERSGAAGVHAPRCFTALAVARLALSRGDGAAAVPLLAAALQRLDDWGGVEVAVWPVLPELVEAQVRARDLTGAGAGTRRLATAPGVTAIRTGRAWLAHCRLATADPAALDAAYEEARLRTDEAGDPLLCARTRLVYAERVRRAGRRRDAVTAAQEALTRFDAMGARLWRTRAERELVALGHDAPPAPASLLDGLTPQERQIAQIAATGAPTRQIAAAVFLSPKTVEHHLTHVYRRLGVRSKSELAARLAAGRGEVRPPPSP